MVFNHYLCERLSLPHCVALALFSDREDLLLRFLLFLKVYYGNMNSVKKWKLLTILNDLGWACCSVQLVSVQCL